MQRKSIFVSLWVPLSAAQQAEQAATQQVLNEFSVLQSHQARSLENQLVIETDVGEEETLSLPLMTLIQD